MPTRILSLPLLFACFFVPAKFVSAQNTTVTNPSNCGLGVAIPDNNCTTNGTIYQPEIVEIIENNTPGILGTDVYLSEVRLIIQHTWLNDLNISLLSPSGVLVELTANNGGGEDNFGDPGDTLCNAYTTFAVGACTPIGEGTAPFLNGPYQPHDHFYNLNDGITPANGSWLLLLCDDAVGDIGALEYVALVFEPMICLPITEINVINIDTTSVELEWLPADFCGITILEYGSPGFFPGTDSSALQGVVQIFDCSPVTLSGLLPDTEYELYARRYCEITGRFSPNSCPITFISGCQPPSVTIFENFDTQSSCVGNCLVDCDINGIWQNARNDDMDWITYSGSTNTPGTGPSDDVSGGGKYIYMETSGCTSDMKAVLYSACIALDKQGTDTCHLSFNYNMSGFTVGSLKLEVSEDGGFTWDLLWQKSGNQGTEWQKVFVGLGDYPDGSLLQFRFVGEKTSGLKGDIALDEIAIYGSQVVGFAETIYYFDGDGDGFGDDGNFVLSCTASPPAGYVIIPGDCNDEDEFINPGATEIPCDGIDNNCNIAEIDDDIILPPPPATGDTICSGEIPVICATPVEGNFILWYDAVKTDSVVWFGTCYSPTNLPPNNSPVPVAYSFLVGQTLDFSCFTVDLAEVIIIVNPLPRVSTADMPEICPGASFNLASLNITDANFTGGLISFHNTSPADSGNLIDPPIISPVITTDYYFLMTSPDGCTDEGTVTVTVKPGPDLTFSPSDSFSLCRESIEMISIQASGGTGGYGYFWSTGSSDSQIEVEASFVAGTRDVYFVTVTDEEGCFSTDSVIVTTTNSIDSVRVIVTDVSECMGLNGSINIIPLNGTPPFDFAWTGTNGVSGSLTGVTDTAFITGLAQGGYRIEITDSSDEMCSFHLRNIIVQGPGAIILDPTVNDVGCYAAGDGEICLNIQGDGNIQYLWNSGDTTLCISGLNGGNYAVTITSGQCETVLSEIQVDEPDSLFVLYEVLAPSCFAFSDGSITLTTFGGTPPYQYQWSTGDIAPYLLNKPASIYSVTVTDFHNCSFVQEIELPAPEALIIQLDSLKNMSCNGVSDGFIQVTGIGGTAPYQYEWNTGSTSSILVNLSTANYQVTVTDFNNCTATAFFDISNPDTLKVEVTGLIQPQCLGDSTGIIELTGVGGTPPYTFFGPQGVLEADRLDNLGVGVYEVFAVDFYGCQSESIEVVLTSSTSLDYGLTITAPDCVGPATGSIQLQPTGDAPFAYQWLETGDTTAFLNNLTAGTYAVRVTDANGCIYDTTFVLAAPQFFNLDFAVSQPSCFGVNDGIIDVLILSSGTPPFTWNWSDGSTDSERTDLMPGDYQLTISGSGGCAFISDTIRLYYPELLQIETEEVGLPLCFGDSTAYIETNVTGGTQPYNINWLGTGLVTEDISGLPADDYRIIILDAKGCAIDTTFILDGPSELIPGVDILQGQMCTPATGDTLLAFASGGIMPYSFSWSEGTQGALLTGVSPGSYSLTVEDVNGCSAVAEGIKLREKTGAIILDTFIVNGISCAGFADANMTAIVSNGSGDYLYHFTPTYIINTSADSITRGNLVHSSVYSVTVTDVNSGCSVSSEEVVLEAPLPLTISQDSFEVVICYGGNDGSLYITVGGGTPEYSFSWYNQEDELVGSQEDLIGVTAGAYTVSVTDENGCVIMVTDSSVVNQSPLLVNDTTIITDVLCRNDSTGMIDISIEGGVPPYSYEWSYGGVTEEDLIGVPFGSYSVTITDIDTCRAIFPFFFVGQPLSSIELSEEEVIFPTCFNSADGSIMITATGGGSPYAYYWNYNGDIMPGQVADSIINLSAGTYELVLTDTSGCVEQFYFDLVGPDSLELNIIGIAPNPPDFEGSVTADVNGGTPEYTYLWSTGDMTMSIEVSEAAIYSVTVTDANDCEIIDSILLVPNNDLLSPISKFHLFPNPASRQLYIELELKTPHFLELELLDLFGRVVKKITIPHFSPGIQKINVDDLPAGLYHLKCSLEGEFVKMKQVVVE